MPAKTRRQQEYLIIHKGIEWVRDHGFDVINPQAYENNREMRRGMKAANHRHRHKKRR